MGQYSLSTVQVSALGSSLKRYIAAIAAIALLAPPLTYGLQSFRNISQQLDSQARFSQILLQDVNLEQLPEQDPRLQRSLLPATQSHIVLRSASGREIYRSSSHNPLSPEISREISLLNQNHKLVATIHVSQSVRPLVFELSFMLALSMLIGLLIYNFYGRTPLHRIQKNLQQLDNAEQTIRHLESEKEEALQQVKFGTDTIRHLATHDLLTNLPNRPYLEKKLHEAINDVNRGAPPFALVLLDINRFKEINDTLGHQCGDLVIREISRRLKETTPNVDAIARVGGDEFAIIINDANTLDEAQVAAMRIQQALELPYNFQGFALDTSASLGLAMYPQHAQTPDQLIQRADVAMYLAKGTGKDLVIYQPEMDPNSVSQLTLRGELHKSIENGDLELYYQPKIDLNTRAICGAEALVRWNHPERGLISPMNFIPVAEQTGLIHPLTNLVMNKAIRQTAQWQQELKHFRVALNLSARNLHDVQLPARLRTIMHAWQVSPSNLVLEITESAIMAEPARAERILRELSEMGLHISIDDYGTGYSSLSYIKRLPIDEIKIDRSFISEMLTNENDGVIVRATIDMAHDLGLKVTAEGVENQETWDLLREYKCDLAQGYFMSQPLPVSKFNHWLLHSPWGASPSLRLVGQAKYSS
ncbi:MAG: EAL domain-containing protein [Gammaproteobacteria bacterium]|nr:EAL domain-containing protein [Gammaproteobacteria bacterium]